MSETQNNTTSQSSQNNQSNRRDVETDAMKATNVSLTPPEQDLRNQGRDYPDYPPGQRERVPVDSGGTHAAPTYGGGPGHEINPDVDPAAPVAHGGPLAREASAPPPGQQFGAAANDLDEGARPAADNGARIANPGQSAGRGGDNPDAGGGRDGGSRSTPAATDPWMGTPQDLAPGALTTNPGAGAVGLAPGAMTTNANAPVAGGRIQGDPSNVPAGNPTGAARADVPPPLPADHRDVRGARVDVGGRGESVPHGRTRPAPGPEQQSAQSPQIQNEPKGPLPPQHQGKPGLEYELNPRPHYMAPRYKAAGKLEGKAALITGGDSGIGRAVAVLYAREGADVAIVFLPAEMTDALETHRAVEAQGRKCVLIPGDLTDEGFCRAAVAETVKVLGKIDVLVSNAGWQNRKSDIESVSEEEFDTTFKTNVYAYFRLAKAAIPHMAPGSAIIATSSETGLQGSKQLLDYSATKGAINAFTKALAQQLVDKGIRVNAVAPGPVWTPLNVADQGMDPKKVSQFGSKTPIGRPAQPEEIAPAYVFLASDADSSYITGIVLNEMGGTTTAG